MASVRMTQELCKSLARDVLRHRFGERYVKLVKDRALLANDVYNDIYKPAMQDQFLALPDGWLPRLSKITVQFGPSGSDYEELQFNGSLHGHLVHLQPVGFHADAIYRPVPYADRDRCLHVYRSDMLFSRRHRSLKEEKVDLEKDTKEAEAKLRAAIGSFGTLAKLFDAWPELAPFIGKYQAVDRRVPAPPIKELNRLLSLPVKEAA